MNSVSNKTQYPVSSNPSNWSEPASTTFVPTAVQLERDRALKRFNLWAVYVPLGVVVTAVLALLIYLLIIAIWPPYEDTRMFLSGIADIILILFMLPVVLIFGLVVAGLIGGGIYWRKSRQESDAPELQKQYGRLRLLLWKVDQKLSGIYRQIDQVMPKIAGPVIRYNATLAYINTWLDHLKNQFKRHEAE
ncbi:MAG: hypothetical protein H6657_29355 [Ardenticatenaceae bacterium]|nr:hypothetical protein [Ardenticatenaceae bacterium]